MSGNFPNFLVSPNGQSPKNLSDSIRKVRNASAGFIQSWGAGDHEDAYETSQEAFEHLDYIQNEILRQRDSRRNESGWTNSDLKVALSVSVGEISTAIGQAEIDWFLGLSAGQGALPADLETGELTLEVALNKLKHRDTAALNFSADTEHKLFLYTRAGMGQPDSISRIDLSDFCSAAAKAANLV